MKIILFLILSLLPISNCYAAIAATAVWEFRVTASANNVNGGGYVTGGGGTDFSQQDAAERSWLPAGGTYTNDLSITDATPSVVTSASYNFAAADVGNVIHLTAGTNVIVGWYEIVSVGANAATLDEDAMSGAPSADGSGYEGGSMSLNSTLDDDFFEQLEDGHLVYILDGSYTVGESILIANDGGADLPIIVEGYKTTRGDDPTGTDRPDWSGGGSTFFDIRWIIKNLVLSSATATSGTLNIGASSNMINCKATNTNAGANHNALKIISGGFAINCEGVSTNGDGIEIAGTGTTVINSYFHDSDRGIQMTSSGSVFNCIMDTCATTGLNMSFATLQANNSSIINNVIFGAETPAGSGIVLSATVSGARIFNNIVYGWVTGITQTGAQLGTSFGDYNVWFNNTANTGNWTQGANKIESDPDFVDAGGGDFTVNSGSPVLNAALQMGTTVGATGDYKWNIGADQDSNAAAAGGGSTGFFFVD